MQKILLVVEVVCIQLVFGGFTENDLDPANRECLKELNLSADVLLKNFHEDWTGTEGNKDFDNVCLCTSRKGNYLKDDDTFNVEKYKDFLVNQYFVVQNLTFDNPAEAALNGLDACKDVKGSDIGDTNVKHYNCLINHFKTVA